MPAVNYDYDEEDFRRWHIARAHSGLSFKEWVRQALNTEAERQTREREEAERRRRGR